MLGSSCGSLGMDLILLSLMSLKSSYLICSYIISCSVFTPTPTPFASFYCPCSFTSFRSSFLSSRNLYILFISSTSIFLNSARQPQWHLSPPRISSIFWFWLPISLTTLVWSSKSDPPWIETGLDNSPNLIVGQAPVFLVDLMLTKSPMTVFCLRDEKLAYWWLFSMECSITLISINIK